MFIIQQQTSVEDSLFGKPWATCLTDINSFNQPNNSAEESAVMIVPILQMKKLGSNGLPEIKYLVSERGRSHPWAEPTPVTPLPCIPPLLQPIPTNVSFVLTWLRLPGPPPPPTPYSPLPLRHNHRAGTDVFPPGVSHRAILGAQSVTLTNGCHLVITLYFYRCENRGQERSSSFLPASGQSV